jgi:hypothetical protein
MIEPGIEPGTSWLVIRSSDHQTTRLVHTSFENPEETDNWKYVGTVTGI